jgi:hypothetical protein
MINVYKIVVGKTEGERPFGRTRHRWQDNIRMDLSNIVVGRCALDSSGSG